MKIDSLRVKKLGMSDAMVQLSLNNILANAGSSMLAQANQTNESALVLLK